MPCSIVKMQSWRRTTKNKRGRALNTSGQDIQIGIRHYGGGSWTFLIALMESYVGIEVMVHRCCLSWPCLMIDISGQKSFRQHVNSDGLDGRDGRVKGSGAPLQKKKILQLSETTAASSLAFHRPRLYNSCIQNYKTWPWATFLTRWASHSQKQSLISQWTLARLKHF